MVLPHSHIPDTKREIFTLKKILLASRNKKKARELAEILAGLPYEVISLENYPDCPEVEEDGETFEANSEKKAREVSLFSGEWTLGDDSGLVVDALDGAPGVYSARYGGLNDDASRNQLLLVNLENVSEEDRTARFVCCATLFGDGKVLVQTMGTCMGSILEAPRGSHGFGYDPVFQPAGMLSSMAELEPEVKHRISHRGKALESIREFLLGIR
jgi:XTP/dITP diphosphohydrolase